MDILEGWVHKCPICGKEFWARSEYAFKCNVGKKLAYFCSWHCIRKYEKEKEKEKEQRRKKREAGRCSYCMAAINPKDRFCHECGNQVK
jgi:YHS domain-containing protein